MEKKEDKLKEVISHAKEYGYVFPSSEIYDGLAATYDYGQLGAELKKNIKDYWWTAMVQMHEEIVGIDAAIFMHPKTWKASGHVDAFNDPLIDNKDSKKRYRADVLVEEFIEKYRDKIKKEVEKGRNRFADEFDEVQFLATNPNVKRSQEKIDELEAQLSKVLGADDLDGLKAMIEELNIVCPISGTSNWTDVRQFNLMFATELGSVAGDASTIYLRPETAQGIFVNFLNVQKSGRMKIPFGIAQIGKAFRNEIVARQFIFRMREFEQMEMQFFIKPGTQKEWYAKWKADRLAWHLSLGLGEDNYRFHDHDKLAHYADAACDIEFNFPFGFKELEGIHSRTDFDLSSHEKFSSKKIKYFDTNSNESYTPYVLETSIGLDRMFLAIFSKSLIEEKLEDGSFRTVLKFPKILAPKKIAVLPLLKKDGLPELSKKILKEFKWDYNSVYDEKDAIGRRYRRQDALGTPYCLTIDHQSLKDGTITIRDRDTMAQQRLTVQEVKNKVNLELDLKSWLTF